MRHLHTAIQMIIVGLTTTLLAVAFNLEYAYTSGVIAILSINMTKKETIKVALRRTYGVLIALLVSTLFFVSFGYELWVYLIFIILFILALWILNIPEGIVVSLVLVIHLLTKKEFDIYLLLNELAIYGLGLVIALAVHLLYPKVNAKKIAKQVTQIDEYIKDHMFALSLYLKDLEGYEVYQKHAAHIKDSLTKALNEAETFEKNQVMSVSFDYRRYLLMRSQQLSILDHIYKLTSMIQSKEPITTDISAFVLNVCQDIGVENKATSQKKALKVFRDTLTKTELPKSRTEFESRAILYQILNDIESFLTIKESYHEQIKQ